LRECHSQRAGIKRAAAVIVLPSLPSTRAPPIRQLANAADVDRGALQALDDNDTISHEDDTTERLA